MSAGGELSLTVIKWGGSLITDKQRAETAKLDVIDRLAGEVAAAGEEAGALLLAHGSGSFGHIAANKTALDPRLQASAFRQSELLHATAQTQDAAARLHRLVISALLQRGVACYSLAPSSFARYVEGRLVLEAVAPLCAALRLGLVTVTYGDVVMDSDRGAAIASTETVLDAVVAPLANGGIAAARCLWLGATEGVLDHRGSLVEAVDRSNLEQVREWVGGSAGVDVTGGMQLRLEAAWALAKRGVPSTILDGRVPGRLTEALRGEAVPGTRVDDRDAPCEAAQTRDLELRFRLT